MIEQRVTVQMGIRQSRAGFVRTAALVLFSGRNFEIHPKDI